MSGNPVSLVFYKVVVFASAKFWVCCNDHKHQWLKDNCLHSLCWATVGLELLQTNVLITSYYFLDL